MMQIIKKYFLLGTYSLCLNEEGEKVCYIYKGIHYYPTDEKTLEKHLLAIHLSIQEDTYEAYKARFESYQLEKLSTTNKYIALLNQTIYLRKCSLTVLKPKIQELEQEIFETILKLDPTLCH